jgi:hypothetical protein
MVIRFEACKKPEQSTRLRPLESALRNRGGRLLTVREIAHRTRMLEHLMSVARNHVRDQHHHADEDHDVRPYSA